MAENPKLTTPAQVTPVPGTAGLNTQTPGQPTTASGAAAATGGMGNGNFIGRATDKKLFEFESDDTPLMALTLYTKPEFVNSAEVEHWLIDEEKTSTTTTKPVTHGTGNTFELPVAEEDRALIQPWTELRVRNVNGYNGTQETPGVDLGLYVIESKAGHNPICTCINGPKTLNTDQNCGYPDIPANSVIDILSTAVSETRSEVNPSSSVPAKRIVYLQKRVMTTLVSKYFDSQEKEIPFGERQLAKRELRKFKRDTNRSLWIGNKGMKYVDEGKAGIQPVYFSEGLRYQFPRELQLIGDYEYDDMIAIAQMAYTGADVPNEVICLCGTNALARLQRINFTKHPHVMFTSTMNKIGWKVFQLETVFGTLQFKLEPTLNKIGYSNSFAVIGLNRLVNYKRTNDHTKKEDVQGHEATLESNITWQGLALKGSCHLFVNGETNKVVNTGSVLHVLWKKSEVPSGPDLLDGAVYYLTQDVPGIDEKAIAGTLWAYQASDTSWHKVEDVILPE